MHSRSRSAWPQCRAYSSIMCTTMSRRKCPSAPTKPRSSVSADEPLGELHLRPPGRPGLGHHLGITDRAVEVLGGLALGTVVLRHLLAGHPDPEPDLLHPGHVADQAQQGHRGRRHRAPGELLRAEVGALQLQGQPVVAEVVQQHRPLAVLRRAVRPGVVLRGDEHVRPREAPLDLDRLRVAHLSVLLRPQPGWHRCPPSARQLPGRSASGRAGGRNRCRGARMRCGQGTGTSVAAGGRAGRRWPAGPRRAGHRRTPGHAGRSRPGPPGLVGVAGGRGGRRRPGRRRPGRT